MNTIKSQLMESLKNKEARDLFVSQNIGNIISAQLYSMREKKDWTQEGLAQKVEMAQARISVLENPNYENFSIKTLKRLASAFDVGLMVRFVSFGELAEWVSNLSPEDLAVPDFEYESQLQEVRALATAFVGLASFRAPKTQKRAIDQTRIEHESFFGDILPREGGAHMQGQLSSVETQ